MLDSLKKEAMKRGMKLMTNPKFMQMMADPRVMKAISQAFALRGRVQSEVDGRLKELAETFKLATRQDVQELRRNLRQMERNMNEMERRLEQEQQ